MLVKLLSQSSYTVRECKIIKEKLYNSGILKETSILSFGINEYRIRCYGNSEDLKINILIQNLREPILISNRKFVIIEIIGEEGLLWKR